LAPTEAIPDQPTALVDVDCSEYPCLALFSVAQDVEDDSGNPALPMQAWLGRQPGWDDRKPYAMALPDR
jgi:hypothetical protein